MKTRHRDETISTKGGHRQGIPRSVPNSGQKLLHFAPELGGKWEQGQPRSPAEISIEIHAMLDGGNAKLTDNAPARSNNALLFQRRKFVVAFFPGGIEFLARPVRRAS